MLLAEKMNENNPSFYFEFDDIEIDSKIYSCIFLLFFGRLRIRIGL